ncbi:HAUS4 [Bugula neritina]|uniref:HAUS4 n=1 Tax=Bugula neritina TaxID=10212 RepID=A0A7J7JQN8_BUGNE|nr:HAUS4 [Bugula neritina]
MDTSAFFSALSTKLKEKYQHQEDKELEDVKMKWYRSMVVSTAAREVCNEHMIELTCTNKEDGKSIQPNENIVDLNERLLLAESEFYLKKTEPDASDMSNTLNITPSCKTPFLDESTKKEFQKLVQERIRKKLLDLSQFYQPSSVTAGTNLLHAKASQLCAVVLKDIDTLKKNKEEIENLKRQKQSQLQQLQQEYSQTMQLLETILAKYKLSSLHEYETGNVKRLAAKGDTLAAKIAFVEKELLANTYTPEMIKELTRIRSQLDSQLAKTQEALINAETGIQACVNLGPEFKQIAIEYSQLKKDIEARNWALQELQLAATRQ